MSAPRKQPSSSKFTDLNGNPADLKEAKEKADAAAKAVKEKAAALRAIQIDIAAGNYPVGIITRPVSTSSGAMYDAKINEDEKALLAETFGAYNEPPVNIPDNQDHQKQYQEDIEKLLLATLLQTHFTHKPGSPDEAMKVDLQSEETRKLIIDSLGGDLKTDGPLPDDKKTQQFTFDQRQRFTLLGRKVKDLLKLKAEEVATLILHAGKKEIEKAIALVKERPDILRCKVSVKDRLGRKVIGTPLEIALMARDMDLKPDIKEEKDHGAAERLIAVSDLTQDEIDLQRKVVTSDEAKIANEKRNQRYLAAVKKFGEGIIRKAEDHKSDPGKLQNFEEFQALCAPLFDQFEKELKNIQEEETITLGYIFNPMILAKAADWFEFGYELCLVPKDAKDIKLEKENLYIREKDGCIAYSVITPDGKEVRDVKTAIKAPQPFDLDKLTPEALYDLKYEIFEASSNAQHTIKNLTRFGGWYGVQDVVFSVNGYGYLQTKLSSRDAHVARHGIGMVVDSKEIPERTLNNDDGSSHFNSSSRLGRDFYLGYYGRAAAAAGTRSAMLALRVGVARWKTLCEYQQQHCKTYAAQSTKTVCVPINVSNASGF